MEQNLHPQTALDRMVTTEKNQVLKASLPYLPPSGQRILSIYTKFTELSNTLALFPGGGQDMRICEAPSEPVSPLSYLQEIRQYLDGPAGNKADNMIHMMLMVQILQLMNTPD